MITREALHQMIDELPEAALPAVARYLALVRDDPFLHSLLTAPEEDEELSTEEQAALAAARRRRAEGSVQYTPNEVLQQEIGW
jgi:hypothetical protein